MSESTPEHVGLGGRHRMLPVKALAQGIERTRADVAVNDPQAGQTQDGEPALVHRRFTGREARARRRQELRELKSQAWRITVPGET